MALSGLPAAGGCFCAALMLALVADSDPGLVYGQQRWLGAVVAAGAACAFAAMIGWATLPRGGLPAPVLLMTLAVAAAPFTLPGELFLPAAVVALAACAVLVTRGLARPPTSPRGARRLTGGLAVTALLLAIGQAFAVGLHDPPRRPRAEVRASVASAKPAAAAPRRRAQRGGAPATRRAAPPPAAEPPAAARTAPRSSAPAASAPATTDPSSTLRERTLVPAAVLAGAERFVRDYYAALDRRRFVVAWRMLSPDVQSAFGGFALWRRGYARTVASSPGAFRVAPAAGGATVGLTLRAGDRDACGKTVVRHFAVTWHLARTDAGWRAADAAGRALAGAAPAAAC